MDTQRWLVVLLLLTAPLAWAMPVAAVPEPGVGHWVSDPLGVLRREVRVQVDEMGSEVDAAGQGQLAVVVVDSTGQLPSRAYGTALFNQWGVGHAAVNDGVLLLIALRDHRAEIVLGRGIDSPASTAVTDRIMRDDVVAEMKQGNVNGAVLYAAAELQKFLAATAAQRGGRDAPGTLRPASLVGPAAAPSQKTPPSEAARTDATSDPGADGRSGPLRPPPGWKPPPATGPTRPAQVPTRGGVPAWPLALGSLGLAGAGGVLLRRRRKRFRPRPCDRCGGLRVRLDELAEDAFLNKGQQVEESVRSVDYDVWYCAPCDDALIVSHPRWFSAKARCPRCGYRTYSSRQSIVSAPTTMSYGEIETLETCANCQSTRRRLHRIPPIPSSGMGTGSSFGGGSSAGGGSSGSW